MRGLALPLLLVASIAGAQRPWVGLDLAGTHVSMRNTANNGSSVDATAGVELRARVGWRFASVAIARDFFAHHPDDATLSHRVWSIDPRVDVCVWRKLGVFGEARFAKIDQSVDGLFFGTPFESESDGTFRGFGGGVTYSLLRGVGIELGLTRSTVKLGSTMVDGFDIGTGSRDAQDMLTTRLGVSVRWP